MARYPEPAPAPRVVSVRDHRVEEVNGNARGVRGLNSLIDPAGRYSELEGYLHGDPRGPGLGVVHVWEDDKSSGVCPHYLTNFSNTSDCRLQI